MWYIMSQSVVVALSENGSILWVMKKERAEVEANTGKVEALMCIRVGVVGLNSL